jgi:hypothetical protein
MRQGSRTDPTTSVPPPPAVDREAPTPRISGTLSAYLTIAQELLAKLGDRPGG